MQMLKKLIKLCPKQLVTEKYNDFIYAFIKYMQWLTYYAPGITWHTEDQMWERLRWCPQVYSAVGALTQIQSVMSGRKAMCKKLIVMHVDKWTDKQKIFTEVLI